jgi:hypothetical protein
MITTNRTIKNPIWKLIYRIGAVAGFVAAIGIRRNMSAEFTAFNGFGVFAIPETLPVQAAEWLTLLQNNPFVGLVLLDVLDLVEYALLGLMFAAVFGSLQHSLHKASLLAGICAAAGIITAFVSNQAFAMLSLSRSGMFVVGDMRSASLATAETLLARQSIGAAIALFLVLLAGLILSVLMLRSGIFSKTAAVIGILANAINLFYFPALLFTPAWIAVPPVIAAPLRITWYVLVAIKLFSLAKTDFS